MEYNIGHKSDRGGHERQEGHMFTPPLGARYEASSFPSRFPLLYSNFPRENKSNFNVTILKKGRSSKTFPMGQRDGRSSHVQSLLECPATKESRTVLPHQNSVTLCTGFRVCLKFISTEKTDFETQVSRITK
jgi:hypothetical protein